MSAVTLPETNYALGSYFASTSPIPGLHPTASQALVQRGKVIGVKEYDPVFDGDALPDPTLIESLVTGNWYVPIREPNRTMNLNIVLHVDPKEQTDLPWVTAGKREMVAGLCAGLIDAHAGFLDMTRIYRVGDIDSDQPQLDQFDPEPIPETESPEGAATEIESLSFNELTVVFSTFKNLPVYRNDPESCERLIAVNARHLLEVGLLPNRGIFYTGESENPAIDTADREQLNAWNDILAQRLIETTRRLLSAHIPAPLVVYDPLLFQGSGYNLEKFDVSMAQAINTQGAHA